MKNEFFNPDECPFEVLGFFEELSDPMTRKFLGQRDIPEPTRPLGAAGVIEYDLEENVELRKSGTEVIIKASAKRPRRVQSMLQIKCGRVKEKGNEDEK